VPLTGNNWPDAVEIEGQPPAAKESDRIQIPLRAVTTGYFNLMGLAIRDGRDVRSSDAQDAPRVAVVNQTLADRYFGKQNPIGKKLWLNGRQRPSTEIIGMVSNGRTDDLTQPAEPEIYLPLWQATAFSKHLVVRTAADPRSVVAAVERELRAADPTAAVENVKTLEQVRGDSLASRTFAMELLVGFSIIGSVLTLVGIYGVLSLSVASRKRELAIRSALGAEQRDIQKLVFGEGFKLIVGGVIAGIVAAVLLSRVLRTFLFDVKPTDPVTLIAVGLMFVIVASLACWVPTQRAGRVNPLEALRYE
jgi:putative ABC transport system permease protein